MLGRAFVAAAVAFLGFSCADVDNGGPSSGNTQILLTDAPFPYGDIAKVEVHIVSVEASADVDTSGAGTWTSIAAPDRVFDLLTLQRGTTALLGDADLPAGTYRAIRLTIDPSKSRVVRNSGAEASVQWPLVEGGLIVLHALVEEPLATGPGNRIVIDFDVGRSFLVLGSMAADFVFSPWLRAVNENATGDLAGEVYWTNSIEGSAGFGGQSGPLANATVTVYRGNPAHEGTWWVAATGTTDAQGRYRIAFLRDADYIVRFAGTTPEGYGCAQFQDIAVTVQATTTLNAAVFPVDGCVAPDPDPNDTTRVDTTIVTPGGPVAGINIRAWLGSGVAPGDSIGMYAELTNAQGAFLSGRPVTWNISDPTVIQFQGVFGQHVVARALAQGTAIVTATSEGKSDTIAIIVGAPPSGPATQITLHPHSGSGRVSDTIGVNAYLRNAAGQIISGGVTWSVSDATVLQLFHTTPNYAVVRGLKVGSASIIATSGALTRSQTLTIVTDTSNGGGAVANIALTVGPSNPARVNDSLLVGAQLTNAAGQPLFGKTVTWTLSDSSIVNPRHFFGQTFYGRPVRAGTLTVTAAIEGKTASTTITIQ